MRICIVSGPKDNASSPSSLDKTVGFDEGPIFSAASGILVFRSFAVKQKPECFGFVVGFGVGLKDGMSVGCVG